MTPTAAAAIRRAIDTRLREVNTAIPATVVAFDRANRTVTAQPLVKVAYTDESGVRQTEMLPAVTNCPVMYPCVAGRGMTFPLRKGDPVLLMVSQASIDRWFARGGVVDPGDDRHHALSDAFAMPGGMSEPEALDEDAVHETATRIEGDEIHAGGTEPLVTLAVFRDFVDTYYAVHTHTGVTTGPGTSAVASVGAATGALFPGTSVLKGA